MGIFYQWIAAAAKSGTTVTNSKLQDGLQRPRFRFLTAIWGGPMPPTQGGTGRAITVFIELATTSSPGHPSDRGASHDGSWSDFAFPFGARAAGTKAGDAFSRR